MLKLYIDPKHTLPLLFCNAVKEQFCEIRLSEVNRK